MNAAKITISEYDASFNVAALLSGIICVQGITKRGPINGTQEIIKSWTAFEKLYGGLISTSDFPLYCKIMLESGVMLRVKRCVDYATVAKAQLPVVPTTAVRGIGDSGNQPLFRLDPKHHGADYNNLSVVISAASNGSSSYFNLEIKHSVDTYLNEKYENLTIVGKPTAAASDYLNKVVAGSSLVDVTYLDLNALTGTTLRPVNQTTAFSGGANGNTVDAADYTGSSSDMSGWFGFDGITDSITLMAPEIAIVTGGSGSNTLLTGAIAYVEGRKNMNYVASYDNAITSVANLVTARGGLAIDSSYFHGYAGGVKYVMPDTGVIKNLLANAHIAIAMTESDKNYGENYSYAGLQRGVLKNVIGPVNNFSNPADLDTLANAQINTIIVKNNRTVIWGNITGQLADSKLSQISVRRFLNKLKLELTPVLEKYIDEPNEIQTWKALYNEVKPLLDGYKSYSKRALNEYSWKGDQNAKTMNDLVINSLSDVNQGKYLVRLELDIINAIREIGLAIYITKTGGVTIEEI